MKRLLGSSVVFACAVGCAENGSPDATESTSQAATVCGTGSTVKGIDVSHYQGTIDWSAVAGDGVEFAFVRVSDGLGTIDSKFPQNWAGSRANGILHGAYQFFRPGQDAIAQADLLLQKMGTLEADDLPPVIDVEAADGLSPGDVESQVRLWVDHVKDAIGKDPIIYTGFYFWRDQVGAPDLTGSPLWHAQYSSAQCPTIAPPWQDWAFWQYTSSGSIAGISGNVDTNRFNGTRDDLVQMTMQPIACGTIGPDGGTIDDGDPCFKDGGPSQYLRRPTDAGEQGDLVWTHTTANDAEVNFAQWNLDMEVSGTYRIEVSTPAAYAQSAQAHYVVHTASGDHDIVIDQAAVDGWQTLGDFDLAVGADQWVHVGDNTGEPVADNVQIVFDAVKLTRIDTNQNAEPDPTGGDPGSSGGCNAGGSAGLGISLALGALLRRRRGPSSLS